MINNLPRFTYHGDKKQFVYYILSQRSVLLKEAEEYTQIHKNTNTTTRTTVGIPYEIIGVVFVEQAEVLKAGH